MKHNKSNKARTHVFNLILIYVSIICFANTAWPIGKAHLLFHMGFGTSHQFFVGGTIKNEGNTAINRGFIVISILDHHCFFLEDKLFSFGIIQPGETLSFKISLEKRLQAYRLAAFQVFDDMSFPLPAIDDTLSIIQAREQSERLKCTQSRGLSH